MAEQLFYEDPQLNCNSSEDNLEENQLNSYSLQHNYKEISACQDVNGDYKRTICDAFPNNNVFVGATVSPCYNSELDYSNNTNNVSAQMESTPSSSSPASGKNLYSNASTPANFRESDTFSESSQGILAAIFV